MNRQQQRVGRGHNEQYIQMHNGVNYQIGSPNYSTTTTTRLNDLTNILPANVQQQVQPQQQDSYAYSSLYDMAHNRPVPNFFWI